VAARAILKQAKLRQLYRVAAASAATLLDTLNSALDTATARIEGGRAMTGEAGNGFSATFQILKDFTPEQSVEVVAELLNVYDEATAELVSDGTASPTDAQILARMLILLRPLTEVGSDYSLMRCGA
jgi:hypothetical protein